MLGLLGGTFDPIHVGHLRLAIEIRERLALDEVRLLPAPRPRLRDTPQVDPETRMRLLRAAITGIAGLEVDGRELAASGPTRTVDTLISVRREHKDRPVCLIIGADAARRLDQWHQWERLVELAHLVIARRPGTRLPRTGAVAELIATHGDESKDAIRQRPAGVIQVCDIPGLEISATAIRESLAQGRSIEFLVPEGVRQMLLNEDLYVRG